MLTVTCRTTFSYFKMAAWILAPLVHVEFIAYTLLSVDILSVSAWPSFAGLNREKDVRLINGSKVTEGRVEVYQFGRWVTICTGTRWDVLDAVVVCNQLGYRNSFAQTRRYEEEFPGPPVGLINNVNCNGSESKLTSCQYYKTACGRWEDATYPGVDCNVSFWALDQAPNNIFMDVSMDSTLTDMNRGRLIVEGRHEGELKGSGRSLMGGVCNIDDQTANLVCGMTGHKWGKAVHFKPLGALFPIIASNIHCGGYKAEILNYCDVEYSSNGTCGVHGLNGIQCYDGPPQYSITTLAVTCVAAILIIIVGAVAIWYVVCKQKDARPIPFQEFSDDTRCAWSEGSEDDVTIDSSTIT